jgi:hypothetical protein
MTKRHHDGVLRIEACSKTIQEDKEWFSMPQSLDMNSQAIQLNKQTIGVGHLLRRNGIGQPGNWDKKRTNQNQKWQNEKTNTKAA